MQYEKFKRIHRVTANMELHVTHLLGLQFLTLIWMGFLGVRFAVGKITFVV